MASLKDCIDFPYYAIYLSFNKIDFRDYQITANVNRWICKHADGRSHFKPKNSPVQWRFTSHGRGVMRNESAEACRVHVLQIEYREFARYDDLLTQPDS